MRDTQKMKGPFHSQVQTIYYPLDTFNQNRNSKPQNDQPNVSDDGESRSLTWLYTGLAAVGLLITTILSTLLLVGDARQWTLQENLYHIVAESRPSVQLVVQLLSNALALIWVSLLCTLIRDAARIYFQSHSVELDTLRLWYALYSRTINWNMPMGSLLVLVIFIGVTAIPSALWTGALTPVGTTVQHDGEILIPGYHDTKFIVEWPMEIDGTGPSLRSPLGYFTYSVGVQLMGSLLASASAATPVDGRIRQHQKLDYTRFNYVGRSYGVGASVGLVDSAISSDPFHINYSYVEPGYLTTVKCEYNQTTNFHIDSGWNSEYDVKGELPNSNAGEGEDSVYLGHGSKAIVAIGVGRNYLSPVRMLGIAAGEYYQYLDQIQCTLDYKPSTFNISVGVKTGDIWVSPLPLSTTRGVDFATGNLTQVLTRQFELIANDQTNIYVSLVGNSLNASISDTITKHALRNETLTLAEATPLGLENAFAAMADDMLVAYASAQLMIANQTSSQPATVISARLRFGQRVYVQAVFGVNVVVMLLFVAEAIRTRAWRRKRSFDIIDPAQIIGSALLPQKSDTIGHGNAVPKIGEVRLAVRDEKLIIPGKDSAMNDSNL